MNSKLALLVFSFFHKRIKRRFEQFVELHRSRASRLKRFTKSGGSLKFIGTRSEEGTVPLPLVAVFVGVI